MVSLRGFATAAIVCPLVLAACSDNNNPASGTTQRFKVEITNVQDQSEGAPFNIFTSGVVNTAVGQSMPGPLLPGQVFEVTFPAAPNITPNSGARFNFASMFGQSNDMFYSFGPDGIALFDANGNAVTGDVTSMVHLYDAGTEVNQEPGTGSNQAPRQSGPNIGPDENGVVRMVPDGGADIAGYTYPDKDKVLKATLSFDGTNMFTFRIENVGTTMTLMYTGGSAPAPVSPFVYALEADGTKFFELGQPASAALERLAEDGNPAVYGDSIAAITGVTVPLSPGVFAVHSDQYMMFDTSDSAPTGIKEVAEHGKPDVLAGEVDGADGVKSSGEFGVTGGVTTNTGPIGPGSTYSFEIEASPGDMLQIATMYAQSNDFFYGFAPGGIALFDASDNPVSGDVTSMVHLYDAGTEVDELPGFGPNQIIRSAPDVGPDEHGVIMEVNGTNDGFTYPPNSDIIKVTITPL